jgi:hypothetical protein
MIHDRECVSVFRRLMVRPDAAFAALLDVASDPACVPPEAARQASYFADRVRDLTLDERQELFDVTFPDTGAASTPQEDGGPAPDRSGARSRARLVALLEEWGGEGPAADEARARLVADVDALHRRLRACRNPYHHLLAALATLLLATPGGRG